MLSKEILLAYFPKITHARHRDLVRVYQTIDRAWEAEFTDIKNRLAWEDELIHEFLTWKDNLDPEKIEGVNQKEGIHCITKDDEKYPPLLKEIYDPPFCLFVRGALPETSISLAVVGPRSPSLYGKQITRELVAPLASSGLVIVSGLALGIDGLAHETTLDVHGKTVAVLGSGIDASTISPSEHRRLADRIVAAGSAVISEYPPGTAPTSYSFPRRNRIIAGIARGVLIIEASEDSGSLITARSALDSNREVFAVPQNITSRTAGGVNRLIKQGAIPVTEANDILEVLDITKIEQEVAATASLGASPNEDAILKHLTKEPVHIDHLIKTAELPSHLVMSTLTLLEMKGMAKNLGNMMYVVQR